MRRIPTGRPGICSTRRHPHGRHSCCARARRSFPALFSLAERGWRAAREFLMAYAVGFEAGVRSGRTAPGHHKGGAHLTGTLGSIAAAVAGEKLLGLDAQRLTYAMAIAATDPRASSEIAVPCASPFAPARRRRAGCWLTLCRGRLRRLAGDHRGRARLLPIYSGTASPDELRSEFGHGLGNRAQRAQTLRLRHRTTSGDRCGDRHALPGQRRCRAHRSDGAARRSVGDSVTGVGTPTASPMEIQHLSQRRRGLDRRHRAIPQYIDKRAQQPAVVALRRRSKCDRSFTAQRSGRGGRDRRRPAPPNFRRACRRHRGIP